MADPEGVSLGEGIGLQGRYDIRGGVKDILHNDEIRLRRKAAADKAAQAQKDKNDDFLYKSKKDIYIDPKLYHRALLPDAYKVTNEAWDKVVHSAQENPNNYKYEAMSTLRDAAEQLGAIRKQSENWTDAEKKLGAANVLQTAPQQDFYNRLRSGSKEDILAAQNDPMGTINRGEDGAINVGYTIPKGVKVDQDVQKIFKDATAANFPVMMQLKQMGNTRLIAEVQSIPETEAEAQKVSQDVSQALGVPWSTPSKEALLKGYFDTRPDVQAVHREDIRPDILSGQNPGFDPENPDDVFAKSFFPKYKDLGGNRTKILARTIPAPTAAERKKKNYGWDGDEWNNSRFAVRPTAQNEGGVMKEGSGFEVQDLTANENSFKEVWKAPYALNSESGKQSKSFSGEIQGAFTGVTIRRNPKTDKMEYYAKITEPSISAPTTTQSQPIAPVDGKYVTTREISPATIPPRTQLIPYEDVKGKVEAYTAGKDAEGGFKLRPEDYQRLDEINKKITKKGSSTTNFEQRIQNPELKIQNKDGSFSTHKMMSFEADGKYYAAPTIVEKDGKLVELSKKDAVQYALKNKEYKEFKTEKASQQYAEGGYKKGTPLEKSVSKRMYSASRNKTKIIYSDGSEEIIDGK